MKINITFERKLDKSRFNTEHFKIILKFLDCSNDDFAGWLKLNSKRIAGIDSWQINHFDRCVSFIKKREKLNSFTKIYKGMEILKAYNPSCLTIEPINRSFPNGSPDYARNGAILVELGAAGWDMDADDREKLIKLGWTSEQEDQYWVWR